MVHAVGRGDPNRPKAGRGQHLKLRPPDGRNRKAQPPDACHSPVVPCTFLPLGFCRHGKYYFSLQVHFKYSLYHWVGGNLSSSALPLCPYDNF